MAGEGSEDYGKLKMSVGGGELTDCYDISGTIEDGETDVHTLRDNGMARGSTPGKRKAEITWKNYVSSKGFERDYFRDALARKVKQVRVKFPGVTLVVTGRLRAISFTGNVDSPIDFTLKVSGRYSIVPN